VGPYKTMKKMGVKGTYFYVIPRNENKKKIKEESFS